MERSVGVARILRNANGSLGTRVARVSAAEMSAAWLNPLDHIRQRCSGTGISISVPSGIMRAICRATVSAKAVRPPCLRRRTTVRAISP